MSAEKKKSKGCDIVLSKEQEQVCDMFFKGDRDKFLAVLEHFHKYCSRFDRIESRGLPVGIAIPTYR